MAGCFPHRANSGNKHKVDRLVQAILSRGIKLLALDFDQTFIDIHTHGTWDDTMDALALHVRPCFRDLLHHAHQKGVFVCIVSFHPKPWIIRELLRKVCSKKLVDHVYLQAVPWHVARRESPDGRFTGKEFHLRRVVADILKDHNVTVERGDILLLDDDMKNVETAASFGHRSFLVQVDKKVVDYDVLESFERMLTIAG